MGDDYFCPECGYSGDQAGYCPHCHVPLESIDADERNLDNNPDEMAYPGEFRKKEMDMQEDEY